MFTTIIQFRNAPDLMRVVDSTGLSKLVVNYSYIKHVAFQSRIKMGGRGGYSYLTYQDGREGRIFIYLTIKMGGRGGYSYFSALSDELIWVLLVTEHV